MTDNLSHPSPPWPGARKPRAITPRTIHDYNLLAATVARWRMPSEKISRHLGFEEDSAERLLRSTPGRAFSDWLWQQPEKFIKRFLVSVDSQSESEMQAEKSPSPDPVLPTGPRKAEEAVRKFLSGSTEDE